MNTNFKPFALLAAFLIVASQTSGAAAEGHLKLIVKTDEGRQKITLLEENGVLSGEIKEGLAAVAPIKTSHERNLFIIGMGNKKFPIDRLDLGEFIGYGGIIADGRGFSAQAEKKGDNWIISGTIEDDMNRLVNFEAVADDKKGALELSWDDKFISLRKTSNKGEGTCMGSLVKENSERIGRLWCQSSGSLKDAFFNNPDQIIAWIILPFIR